MERKILANSFWILFILFFSYSVLAQEKAHGLSQLYELKKEIIELRGSKDSKDQAWAAYLIGKNGLNEFIPDLLEFLDQNSQIWQINENTFLYYAVLDSLIQLNASVPPEMLLPFYDRFPNQTLILLAKSPAKNQQALLLLLDRRTSETEWLAICNLLTETKSPAFVLRLMSDIKIKISLTISEDGNIGTGGGVSGSSVGCGVASTPDGFPPTALYRLVEQESRGAVVVAPGPHPIYYERQIVQPGVAGQTGVSSSETFRDRDKFRMEYLAVLLQTTIEGLKLNPQLSFSIAWNGTEHYKKEVKHIREKVEGSYKALIKELIERGLLSSQEAGTLAPSISIFVQDLRRDKRIQLPTF
jgi:hypothetical protein